MPLLGTPNDWRLKKVMRNTRKLTLSFGKWCPRPVHNFTYPPLDYPSSKPPHDFAASLGNFLVLAQNTLEKLDLSFAEYIGYYPRLRLPRTRFPWLKELYLAGVTFSHSTQVSWITEHWPTLQTLHLIKCPVILEVYTNMQLDRYQYLIHGEMAAKFNTLHWQMFWDYVLDQFTGWLDHLRDFHVSFRSDESDSSMTAWRYRIYVHGGICTNEQIRRLAEEHLKKDIQAYVRLLKHTGQWKPTNRSAVEEGEEDLADSTEDVDKRKHGKDIE